MIHPDHSHPVNFILIRVHTSHLITEEKCWKCPFRRVQGRLLQAAGLWLVSQMLWMTIGKNIQLRQPEKFQILSTLHRLIASMQALQLSWFQIMQVKSWVWGPNHPENLFSTTSLPKAKTLLSKNERICFLASNSLLLISQPEKKERAVRWLDEGFFYGVYQPYQVCNRP